MQMSLQKLVEVVQQRQDIVKVKLEILVKKSWLAMLVSESANTHMYAYMYLWLFMGAYLLGMVMNTCK